MADHHLALATEPRTGPTTGRAAGAPSASLLRRAAAMEAAGWRNLFGLVARRRHVPEGAQAFTYSGPIMSILIVFLAVSAIEIVAVDLIVHRWPIPRIVALVVGVWGLMFMLGYLATLLRTPHLLSADGLRVRHTSMVDLTITWEDVDAVVARRHNAPTSRTVQVASAVTGTVASVALQAETNVVCRLRRPVEVELPTGPETITELRFYADDANALARRARELLDQPA